MQLSEAQKIAESLNYTTQIENEKLVQAIAQDYITNEVLMIAFMNKEAVIKTLITGKVWYWSTSRKKLWFKGEESGNFQLIKEIYVDCDENALLLKVEQVSGACHEGYKTCFYRKLENGKFKVVLKQIFKPEEVYRHIK